MYELKIKKQQRIKELFLSPIFKKKQNSPIGLYRSNWLFSSYEGSVIALGGINTKNVKLIKLRKFSGFAGIKFFE